jgi:hypothetical protein
MVLSQVAGSASFGVVVWLVIVAVYFLPSIVAKNRLVRNFAQIFILNLFLGWSFVGWVIALIMAFKPVDPRDFSLRPLIEPPIDVSLNPQCAKGKHSSKPFGKFCTRCGSPL